VATAGGELYVRDGRLAAAMPTNDGLTIAFTALTVGRFPAYRADIEGTCWRIVDETAPTLGERLRGGRREERFMGLIAGTTRFDEFFAQANIARILARAELEPLAA
jgi:hypothetical protein